MDYLDQLEQKYAVAHSTKESFKVNTMEQIQDIEKLIALCREYERMLRIIPASLGFAYSVEGAKKRVFEVDDA